MTLHSAIEGKSKGLKIHIPYEWEVVASIAREDPYHVEQLKDIIDLKQLKEDMGIIEVKKRILTESVNWFKICWMRVEEDEPYILLYKCYYDTDAPFKRVTMRERILKKKTRLSQKASAIHDQDYELSKAYMKAAFL